MSRLILVGLLAFTMALTGTAYAEVQNIRISGDLELKAITQANYDLKGKQLNFSHPGSVGTVTNDDDVSYFLSTVHIQVDADLTDNVSATVRLLNQRIWDNAVGGGADQITIDNAYVVLREFFYSPLTIIAGRQDLNYGNGFIVGSGRLADPEGVFAALDTGAGSPHAGIGQEHSAFNSFDAIRLILDFAPLTVEGVLAKANESGAVGNDETLYGIVVNYKLDQWNAEVEPYWFYNNDESGARAVTVNDSFANGALRTYEINRVHTIGMRVGSTPIDNLVFNAEGAFQFGEMIDSTGASYQERDREAWAADIYANYTWVEVPWTPSTGIGWRFFSGEEPSGVTGGAGTTDEIDDFNAWHVVHRGSFLTFIQDFFSGADAPGSIYTTFDTQDTAATTNRHSLYFDVGASPMEDVNLWARYIISWFDEDPRPGRDSSAGTEFNVKATYDYTEDVQLGLWGGWFFPGDYYDDSQITSDLHNDAVAWTVGGASSVKF